MKILPSFDVFRYLENVREKQDGQGHGNGGYSHQEKKEEKPAEEPKTEASSQNTGVEGTSPGLKVVLHDGEANGVRQFTGEEFLRLREAAAQLSRVRGKILDRKP